jgi:hypothetical protein
LRFVEAFEIHSSLKSLQPATKLMRSIRSMQTANSDDVPCELLLKEHLEHYPSGGKHRGKDEADCE